MNYENVLCRRIAAVPPSGIRKFFDIVSEMPDAISLGVGEPDFKTPWRYSDAAIYSLRQGHTHYTGNRGMIELRRAIADYERVRFETEYHPEREILVTVGASEGIDLALRALLEPGDEVLVPEPSYVSYMPGVVFANGVCVGVKTTAQEEFRLTAEALQKSITPRTKALILPYPNNPTGGVMRRADLLKIAEVVKGTNIIVIADEIYAELTYGDTPHVSFAALPGMRERTITLNGFSKAFAMTGWRIGYACAPKAIMDVMVKIHQYTMLCAPTPGQYAALEGLKKGLEDNFADVRRMIAQYDRRRRVIVEGLRRAGLSVFEPMGAFYVFPEIRRTGLTSEAFCEKLLYQERVATVPGDAFGGSGEGFIRCSYAAAMEKITEALERIARFMDTLG